MPQNDFGGIRIWGKLKSRFGPDALKPFWGTQDMGFFKMGVLGNVPKHPILIWGMCPYTSKFNRGTHKPLQKHLERFGGIRESMEIFLIGTANNKFRGDFH